MGLWLGLDSTGLSFELRSFGGFCRVRMRDVMYRACETTRILGLWTGCLLQNRSQFFIRNLCQKAAVAMVSRDGAGWNELAFTFVCFWPSEFLNCSIFHQLYGCLRVSIYWIIQCSTLSLKLFQNMCYCSCYIRSFYHNNAGCLYTPYKPRESSQSVISYQLLIR